MHHQTMEPDFAGRGEGDSQAGQEDVAEPKSHDVGTFAINRILVALDASAGSLAALEAAAELAKALHSQLEGLFVEDVNLLRTAALPFVREIRFPAAATGPLETVDVERLMRLRAAELRREMVEISQRHGIASSFRVVRGSVERELLAAAEEFDLIALGRLGHAVARRLTLGSTARATLARAARPVLIVRPNVRIGRPVIAIDDGGPAGLRAVVAAAFLIEQGPDGEDGELLILSRADSDDVAYARRQQLIAMLGETALHVIYQHFHTWQAEAIDRLIRRQGGGLVVLGLELGVVPPDVVETILEKSQQHVLVIR